MKYSITIILSFLISFGYSKVMYADRGADYQGFNLLYDADKEINGELSSLHLEYSLVTYSTEYSLSYTRGQFRDNIDSYFDSSVNGWGITGAYHIRYPLVNISLEAGGILSFMGAQYLDDLGLKMDGHGYNIGIGLYRTLIKTDKLELIPFVSRATMSSTSVLKDPIFKTVDKYKDTAIKVGLGIKIESPWCSSNYITIQPEMTKTGESSDFSISIGTLINMVDTCY